jgi:broad specificity phosphatase PhoE
VAIDSRWDEYDTDDILTQHSTTSARPGRPAGSEEIAVTTREFQDLLEDALLAWIAAGDEGPTAESWPAFAARVAAALADLAAELRPGGTALVSTSGGVLAAVCVTLLATPAPVFVAFNRVTINTGLTKVVHGRGGTTLISFNDHAHLEQGTGPLVTYR